MRSSVGSASITRRLSAGSTSLATTRNCRSASASHSGPVELVSEDAERLRDDRFGDGKIDLAVGGEVEKVHRLASELHGADEDVGVSDDALHDWARDS